MLYGVHVHVGGMLSTGVVCSTLCTTSVYVKYFFKSAKLTSATSSSSHEFHKNCVDPWLKIKQTCPLCKDNITKEEGNSTTSRSSSNLSQEMHLLSMSAEVAVTIEDENVTPATQMAWTCRHFRCVILFFILCNACSQHYFFFVECTIMCVCFCSPVACIVYVYS